MWCSYFDYLKNDDFEMDEEFLKNKIVDSSVFAFKRLEEMSEYVNSDIEHFSSLSDAFKQINSSRKIEENKENIILSGDINKSIDFMCSFFLSVILKNLIENSCKYADPNKDLKIEIHYSERAQDHLILVKDNAKGMTPEQSKKLFTRKQDSKTGLGMGLVVLNRIIKSHRGSIKVQTQLGIGTSIYISFPKT